MSARRSSAQRLAIKRSLEGQRSAVIGVVASSVVAAASEAVTLILLTKSALALSTGESDVVLVGGWSASTAATALIALCFIVLRTGSALTNGWAAARLGASVGSTLRRDLGRAYLEAHWSAIRDDRPGELQDSLTSFANRASEVVLSIAQGTTAGLSLMVLVGSSLVVDPVASIGVVGAVAVLALLLQPLRRLVGRRSADLAQVNLEYAANVSEKASLMVEAHVFGVSEQVRGHLEEVVDRGEGVARASAAARSAVPVVFTGLAYASLVAGVGAFAVVGATDVAAIGTVIILMLRSLSYGQNLQVALTTMSAAAPFLDRFFAEVDRYRSARRSSGHHQLIALPELSFQSVHLSYGAVEVLRDVSFTIRPGETIGIIGPSGSGKTTLVRLLLGLLEPTGGRVLVGGVPLADVSRTSWANIVAFVPQDPHLLRGTVAENIRFLRDVPDDHVERAVRLAHLEDDLDAWPDGLERQVGELGNHLSGGQQQRVAIARALAGRPALLIMDEPTSALDVRTEHLFRETLANLKEQMTVVIVAHRMSTLESCDRVMVLHEGRLLGFDAPSELERSNTFYRQALQLSGLR